MSADRGDRHAFLEPAVYMATDAVMLVLSFLLTYWFRFHSGFWLVPLGIPPLDSYVAAGLVITLVFVGIF